MAGASCTTKCVTLATRQPVGSVAAAVTMVAPAITVRTVAQVPISVGPRQTCFPRLVRGYRDGDGRIRGGPREACP